MGPRKPSSGPGTSGTGRPVAATMSRLMKPSTPIARRTTIATARATCDGQSYAPASGRWFWTQEDGVSPAMEPNAGMDAS